MTLLLWVWLGYALPLFLALVTVAPDRWLRHILVAASWPLWMVAMFALALLGDE